MKNAVVFPLVIPFAAALLLFIKRENRLWQRGLSLLTSFLMILAAGRLLYHVGRDGIVVFQMGNWPPPFGIMLTVDLLSAVMVGISAVVGLTSVLYSFSEIDGKRMKGSFYSLFHFLLFGVNGAFLTGDLFNLFVFYEVILMASYVLLTLGNEKAQVKFGFVYLVINLTASTLFLVGAGLIFGQLGTLNMAQIAQRIGTVPNKGLVTLVSMIFFCVFGIKCAMFPLYNWLPDAYSAPPTSVSALFVGLLTKVGVYSMFRGFGTLFVQDVALTHHHLLLPLAGLTMLFGVWGAVVQYDIRYILAFHSISQVGYILMGLSLFSPLALAGGIFHMIHHSLVKSSLFFMGGGVGRLTGTQNLKKLGGVVEKSGFLAIFFFISALALSGIPPFSGFFSKYALIVSGLIEGHPLLVTAALVTSLLTLYSMVKIWRLGFWGDSPKEGPPQTTPPRSVDLRSLLVACGVSVAFVVLLTVFVNPLMTIAQKAGQALLNRDSYIQAVLGTAP